MYQGESLKISIRPIANNNNLIQPDDIIAILAVGSQEVKRYSLQEGDIKWSETEQRYYYIIERSHSIDFPQGMLIQETLVKIEDEDFEEGYFSVGVQEIEPVKTAKTASI
jgi:hypothetical protein